MNAQAEPEILEAPAEVEVTLKLRLAVKADLVNSNSVWENNRFVWKNQPNYGQPYWTRSQYTNKIDNRHFILSADTDTDELKAFYKQKMIYVPVSDLDLNYR